MAYVDEKIFQWMDLQPEPEGYSHKHAIFTVDQSVIGIEGPAPSITSAGWSHESAMDYDELMVALETKDICPLMDVRVDHGDLLRSEERNQEFRDNQRPRIMLPAKTTHALDSQRILHEDQAALLHLKTLLYLARTNTISPVAARAIIPTHILQGSTQYRDQQEEITRLATACYEDTFRYAHAAVSKIAAAVDEACGADFFHHLEPREMSTVLGVVFDQYPVFLMSQFRARESQAVDFAAIFGRGVSRKDRLEREKLASFYRYGFVHFCIIIQRDMCSESLHISAEATWRYVGQKGLVKGVQLGGAFDLPATNGMGFRRIRTGDSGLRPQSKDSHSNQ
ncbi:hypothetical protein BUE80_DR007428 [Diplocarpon rosae]|nr:hypothetical protein BUE80_DR007428 [Diplocarpon rosae]